MGNNIQYLESKFSQQKNVETSTTKQAYSYIRFSREHQSEGDSERRQFEGTVLYCQRKGLTLNETFDLRDLGVSAFHGRNAASGKLGLFLQAVKDGRVTPGSALVVEGLDRLSRQNPWATVSLLKELKDYGIEIHLTMADMILSPNEQDDGMKLMYAVAMASRAHDESKTKSKRLIEAFAAKRKAAESGKVWVSKSLPWWLAFEDGQIKALPKRAEVVKRIFELTASGWSSSRISRLLNKEKTPTWRPEAKRWLSCRIRDLIRGEAALGTLTQTKKTEKLGRTYKLVGYYPALISESLAAEARAAMVANRIGEGGRTPQGVRPINLFRGLLRYNSESQVLAELLPGGVMKRHYVRWQIPFHRWSTIFCSLLLFPFLLLPLYIWATNPYPRILPRIRRLAQSVGGWVSDHVTRNDALSIAGQYRAVLEWWGLSLPVDSKGLKIAVAEAEEMLAAFALEKKIDATKSKKRGLLSS